MFSQCYATIDGEVRKIFIKEVKDKDGTPRKVMQLSILQEVLSDQDDDVIIRATVPYDENIKKGDEISVKVLVKSWAVGNKNGLSIVEIVE